MWRTEFSVSLDGVTWTDLGTGERIAGGWQLANVNLPPNATVKARGWIAGNHGNGSAWSVQTTTQSTTPLPPRLDLVSLGGGSFRLFVTGTPGAQFLIQSATSLVTPDWIPWTDVILTNGQGVLDWNGPLEPARFFRAFKP